MKEFGTLQTQPGEEAALFPQKNSSTESEPRLDRRRIFMRGGAVLGAAGAIAALAVAGSAAVPASAAAPEGPNEMDGLWQGVVSPPDNSFPSFPVFVMYGGGILTGSGQVDLTLAALSSTLWGAYKRIGPRRFRVVGRFWTYDSNFNPTGSATVNQINTVSADGNSYHGNGALQYFDNNGNSLGPAAPFFDDSTRVLFS